MRVNELLAGNPDTRYRIREDISYMVIDTEAKKITEFTRAINDQMGGRGLPIMLPVQVTAGYHKLREIVNPNIEQKDSETVSLLKPHWWFTPDEGDQSGRPFRAINLPGYISDGASQCPPVSYLAVWNYLPRLEKDIAKLLAEIKGGNTDEVDPLQDLRVFIVASLAGGTGRGCWNLVAFKIRQCLKEMGSPAEPTGVFFDASCFPNVKKAENRRSLRMNSLTGMSELSAWMRLPNDFGYAYQLPALASPDPDHVTDVIRVPVGDPSERTPVTTAFLVFGDRGKAQLADNDQYHEMAAAALYSLVATGNSIAATDNNQLEKVRSFAATTFEVETVALRRYLGTRVQLDYSKRLWSGDTGTHREAMEYAGDWKGGGTADSFFGRTGFCVADPVQDANFASMEDSQPLVPRLMARADEQIMMPVKTKNGEKKKKYRSWMPIETALLAQNETLAIANARKTLEVPEEDIVGGWETALEKVGLDDANLARTLRGTVRSAFYREGKRDEDLGIPVGELPPSVARARQVVAILMQAFTVSKQNVEGTPEVPFVRQVDGESIQNSSDCFRQFKAKIEQKADRKLFDGLKKFSDKEIEELEEDFKTYKQEAILFELQAYLAAKFKRANKILEALDKALKTLELGLNDVTEEFRDDLCKRFDRTLDTEVFDELFTKDEDEAIFQALPAPEVYKKVYRRTLKPILKEEEIEALLARPSITSEPLAKQLKQELDNLIGGGEQPVYSSREDARSAIRETFVQLVKDNVGLPVVPGGDFMRTHFSFAKVLEDNRAKWNRVLNHWENASDKKSELLDRIRLFLGVEEGDMEEIRVGDRKVKQIPKRILLPSIVGSMVTSCQPWMELSTQDAFDKKVHNTFALVPVVLDEKGSEKPDFDKRVKEVCKRDDVQICHRGSGAGGNQLPEDRILVFSEMGISAPDNTAESAFQYISSLDYWREPEWAPLLARAEVVLSQLDRETLKNTDGDGYFVRNMSKHSSGWVERERGYGYVSPIFLTEEVLNDLRWKPWTQAAKRKDDAGRVRNEAKTALLFGLLGAGAGEALVDAVARKGWTGFPLLKIPGSGKGAESLVFQRPGVTDELAWNQGDTLGTTLENALNYLLEAGLPNEPLPSAREEQAKRGARIRRALLAEKDSFGKVLSALAEEDRQAIRNALGQFLADQVRARRGNPKLWEELYEAWKAEG